MCSLGIKWFQTQSERGPREAMGTSEGLCLFVFCWGSGVTIARRLEEETKQKTAELVNSVPARADLSWL